MRYFVFHGSSFDPDGGWSDFSKAFSTLEEALAHTTEIFKMDNPNNTYWLQVVDIETLTPVLQLGNHKGVVNYYVDRAGAKHAVKPL